VPTAQVDNRQDAKSAKETISGLESRFVLTVVAHPQQLTRLGSLFAQ
jgi:hypothetical protein